MRLLLCADLWGVKVNLDVHFGRQPTIGELCSRAVEVFTAEAEATRPASARRRPFVITGVKLWEPAAGSWRLVWPAQGCCAPPSGGDKDGGPPEGGEPHPPATAAGRMRHAVRHGLPPVLQQRAQFYIAQQGVSDRPGPVPLPRPPLPPLDPYPPPPARWVAPPPRIYPALPDSAAVPADRAAAAALSVLLEVCESPRRLRGAAASLRHALDSGDCGLPAPAALLLARQELLARSEMMAPTALLPPFPAPAALVTPHRAPMFS